MSSSARTFPALRDGAAHVGYYFRFGLVIVWGLLLSLLFMPVAVVMWGNTTLSWAFARCLSWGGLRILGIRVVVSGWEYLAHVPAIVIGNHQSNFDILVHGRVYPRNTVVIGKRELRKIPLFGVLFAATGNIMIDRSDRSQSVAGLDKAVEALRTRGTNIWIFPEGTRSGGKGLGRFKMGGFHMAIAAGVPIIPVVAGELSAVLDVPGRRAPGGTLQIHILPPIPTSGLSDEDAETLRDKTENAVRAEIEAMNAAERSPTLA